VSATKLEEILLAFPGVLECAVLGVPDDLLGEAVKAFVVPVGRSDAGFIPALVQHCRQALPAAFVPKEVVVRPALPKNEAGKILKSALRQEAARA
jgi:long-chain acyl-CoA synthetase